MKIIKEYTTKIDDKNRITINESKYDYYNVNVYENGCILLEPRELVDSLQISSRFLKEMDEAMENFKVGKVSDAIVLSEF